MEILEQLRFVLILIMAYLSYTQLRSAPLQILPSSDPQPEEEEENSQQEPIQRDVDQSIPGEEEENVEGKNKDQAEKLDEEAEGSYSMEEEAEESGESEWRQQGQDQEQEQEGLNVPKKKRIHKIRRKKERRTQTSPASQKVTQS